MPKLQPLDVPWQISPSTPHLGVSSKSFDGVNHGFVTFMGCLGEATRLNREHGGYRQIAVILERIVGMRMYPEFSPDDSERLDGYDWSLALRFQDRENGFKNHYRLFHDQWNSTDICPNPAAYIVVDSEWLLQLGFVSDAPPHLQFQHFLFVGSDYNVEVIAKSMKWEIVGTNVESPNAELPAENGITHT